MRWRLSILALLALLGSIAAAGVPARAAAPPLTVTGSIDGAPFQVDVPRPWNGTLVLWSHGYETPGPGPRPAPADAPDPVSKAWLLGHGYALAASAYSQQGWAVQQALHDQVALLDRFDQLGAGRPRRTIAWGASLGGMITAGLLQENPRRFDGAIPLCGVVGGGVGAWNVALDGAFVFKTLLAPGSALQLTGIEDPTANFALSEQLLTAAQATPQGRARMALVAAVGDTPGWYQTGTPRPPAADYAARERNQFLWSQNPDFFFLFALRRELELRAGGNPSWNTGVRYGEQLERSINRDEVTALYRQAGLDLRADLETLARAPRIAADPGAVDYLRRFITYDGRIRQPVLTVHTTGDGLVPDTNERAYADVVRAAGNERLLREAFVERAGHCAFSPAELVAAFTTLVHRLDAGRWGDGTSAAALNGTAAGLGLGPSAFVHFEPAPYLRPFDARR
jgi:hypothetical protein